MKSVLFALLATLLYGITSVVIEQKLERFSTVALTFLFVLPFIPLGLFFLLKEKFSGTEIAFPGGGYFWLTMALGATYFIADYFFLGAFTAGGNALTITTIVMIVPVVVAILRYFWVGGYPNAYQVLGYVFGAIAVLLLAKGASTPSL